VYSGVYSGAAAVGASEETEGAAAKGTIEDEGFGGIGQGTSLFLAQVSGSMPSGQHQPSVRQKEPVLQAYVSSQQDSFRPGL